VNGVDLHYVEAGAGKAKTIVFLHGFPEFWQAWKTQLEAFGTDYRAIAVDMRGYNLSSKPEGVESYQIATIVEDIAALSRKLETGKFVLVGHDWGGVIAWAFAMAHPGLLDRLVIINGPHPAVFARELRENPAQQKASEYMNLFRSPEAEATLSADNYKRLARVIFYALSEAEQADYLAAWSQPGALTGGLNYYRAMRLPGAGVPVKPIALPTLVIWGEKDTALLTGNLEGLDQHVKNLTVQRIPDGTHWVVHEKPAVVERYIRDFLAK
jgi:pimeloyl-ACP methyl ester carboxylesterase